MRVLSVVLVACGTPEPEAPPPAPFAPAALPAESSAAVTTLSDEAYPDNPNIENRSTHSGLYAHDRITLHHRQGTIFDLELTADNPESATIVLRNVDLAVFVPKVPGWLTDPYLQDVTLQNQEWNRIQMRFDAGDQLLVGDAPEQALLTRIDVANNCLNAGLWELSLFTKEDGKDLPYFQAWFDFPRETYSALFEQVGGQPWAASADLLADWKPLPSQVVDLAALRSPVSETEVVPVVDDTLPPLTGERKKKRKNVLSPLEPTRIGDFLTDDTRFATFSPPGVYRKGDPRVTHLGRLATVRSAVIRDVTIRGPKATEIEVDFVSATGEETRLVIGGFDLAKIPKLPLDKHHDGFQMPMGIGNQSFYQTYAEGLARSSDWYAMLLDADGKWLDSHDLGIDGPLLYQDDAVPGQLHLMLLSFERHAIVGHVVLPVAGA